MIIPIPISDIELSIPRKSLICHGFNLQQLKQQL